MTRFTILGASGFIGSHLVKFLRTKGFELLAPRREESLRGDLGHVIYCIGLTADFRTRPFDAMEAHVSRLVEVLRQNNFISLLYLSSTRVYQRLPLDSMADETAIIPVDTNDPSDIYNLSKLAGESICLANPNPKVRVARLSNVYGAYFRSDNFLDTIVREALTIGHIELKTTMNSCKDYVYIGDVVYALHLISILGLHRLYNVASGQNITHAQIIGHLSRLIGCSTSIDAKAVQINFPQISIQRLQKEFNFNPSSLESNLPSLLPKYQKELINNDYH